MPKQDGRMMRRRIANAYLSSVVSISLVLLLIGVASLVLVNAGSVTRYLKENMTVSVILTSDADEQDAQEYASEVSGYPYVKETRVVSREEGERELADMLGEDFLDVFETSVVPVSVDVALKADYVHPDSLAFISGQLSAPEIVDVLDARQNLVEALTSNIARISVVFAVLIALLLFISFVLINNMVRLSVFARRFTIHTMRLVGATRSFILAPFIRSAALQGLVSAVIAGAVIWGVFTAMKDSFPQLFSVFSTASLLMTTGIVLLCGVLICVLSTLFVVRRLVSAPKDDLYY